jgi:hypothetical protein
MSTNKDKPDDTDDAEPEKSWDQIMAEHGIRPARKTGQAFTFILPVGTGKVQTNKPKKD